MRISTRIIRNPFGASNAQLATQMYGGDGWEKLKAEHEERHRADVAAAILHLPGPLLGVTAGYRADHGRVDYDGMKAEWWSVIAYDGPPDAV